MSTIFAKNLSSWHAGDTISSNSVAEEFNNIYLLLQGQIDDANVSTLSITKVSGLQDALSSKASIYSLQTALDTKLNNTDLTWANVQGKPAIPSITAGTVNGFTVVQKGPRTVTASQGGINQPSRLVHGLGTMNYSFTATALNGIYSVGLIKNINYVDVQFFAFNGVAFTTVPYDFTLVEL